jgi:hypothetical protein
MKNTMVWFRRKEGKTVGGTDQGKLGQRPCPWGEPEWRVGEGLEESDERAKKESEKV